MTIREKVLYHQIHPLKLLTDGSAAVVSLYLLWQRRLRPALIVQFVPALVVSSALIRRADLEPQRRSAFGRHVKDYMAPSMQGVRFAGNAVMSLGAWRRRPGLLLVGLLMILYG